MSGAEAAQVVGSPNVFTTDELRRAVWTYGKFSTDVAYSADSGGVAPLILGGGGSVVCGAGGNVGHAYHTSSF